MIAPHLKAASNKLAALSALLLALAVAACGSPKPPTLSPGALAAFAPPAPPAPRPTALPNSAPVPDDPTQLKHADLSGLPTYVPQIVKTYPHDNKAFTQGLVFHENQWLESDGLYGESSLRRVDVETGNVVTKTPVDRMYFAEGLAELNGHLYQLTWQHQIGFVYGLADFKLQNEFHYTGEGWGLATDGKSLILSDGTSDIRFLDPETFAVQRTIHVRAKGKPVPELNELEYIKGEIYSNIWGDDHIVRIDPATGEVKSVIDGSSLSAQSGRTSNTDDVLNGIAYDAKTDRLFLTGKRWPKIFEVKLAPKS